MHGLQAQRSQQLRRGAGRKRIIERGMKHQKTKLTYSTTSGTSRAGRPRARLILCIVQVSPFGPSSTTGLSEAINLPFSLKEVPQDRSGSNGTMRSASLNARCIYQSVSAVILSLQDSKNFLELS